MSNLLKELGWKVAPPEPPQEIKDNPHGKWWTEKILSTVENLVWLQDKGWKRGKIHIENDLCKKLNIPDAFIRGIVAELMSEEYPALRARFQANS